jgi:hypothetical protein
MSPHAIGRVLPSTAGVDLTLHSARWVAANSDVPSAHGFIAILEAFRASGGTAPSGIVSRLLEDHRVAQSKSLAELIFAEKVFGFEWRATLWIPMFQFDLDDLALRSLPQRVRAALASAWSGWSVVAWFATPDTRLEGHTPAYEGVIRRGVADGRPLCPRSNDHLGGAGIFSSDCYGVRLLSGAAGYADGSA